MAHYKFYPLVFVISVTAYLKLEAQTIPDKAELLQFKQYQLLTDSILAESIQKNEIFSDPFIGNYTVEANGITSTQEHFFIRIKEPDLSKVIPMPGAYPKSLEKTQPFQQHKVPYHKLPKTKIPSLEKDR